MIMPALRRINDPARDPSVDKAQLDSAMKVAGSEPLEEAPTPERIPPRSAEPVPIDGDLQALLTAHGVTEIPKDAPPLVPVARHRDLAESPSLQRIIRIRGIKQA